MTNMYLEGNYAPVTEEVTAFDLPVIGQLPAELNGRYLRNGPNPIEVADPAKHHWFVGDGMVHGVRLREGRAEWYRNRYVGSSSLSERRGQPDIPGRNWNGSTGGPNTNVGGFAGTTWAMVEAGGCPVEMTYELETVGRNDFFGTLPGAFTAHPKVDAVDRRDARDGLRPAAVAGSRAVRGGGRRRQGAPHRRHPAAADHDAPRHGAHGALRDGLRLPLPAGHRDGDERQHVPAALAAGHRVPGRPAAARGRGRRHHLGRPARVLLVPPDERVRRRRRQRGHRPVRLRPDVRRVPRPVRSRTTSPGSSGGRSTRPPVGRAST